LRSMPPVPAATGAGVEPLYKRVPHQGDPPPRYATNRPDREGATAYIYFGHSTDETVRDYACYLWCCVCVHFCVFHLWNRRSFNRKVRFVCVVAESQLPRRLSVVRAQCCRPCASWALCCAPHELLLMGRVLRAWIAACMSQANVVRPYDSIYIAFSPTS
jgi:hypothetical protein